MPKCQNPECNKEIPKNMNYCSENCLKNHIEIKEQLKIGNIATEFKSEENIWIGQERVKRAYSIIIKLSKELCPCNYEIFISNLTFRMGLSRRKIEEDYVRALVNLGFLATNGHSIKFIKDIEYSKIIEKESQSFSEHVKEQKESKEAKKQ